MKKLLQSLFVIMLFAIPAMAQQRTITGTVTGKEDGLPLPGVTVKVKGTTTGTSAAADGKYSIKVPANAKELEFVSLGYIPHTRAIGSGNVINVSLSADSKQLGEVVVTAMGVVKSKRSLGYATQTIKNDQLVDRGDGNILNALQGKVAGVEITGASGSAGASTNIVLRGMSSFSGSNQPLFVVDGIPISNDLDQTVSTLYGNQPANRALDLDPNNIESINILQGPGAAALYGSRASNGAIVITTKKGSGGIGKLSVALNSSYGVQNVYGFPKLQNEYGQGASGSFNAISGNSLGPKFGTTPSLANGLIVAPGTSPYVNGVTYKPGDVIPYTNFPDNIKDFFTQGHTWDNNLSINSGDAKNYYSFSIGNSSTTGILPVSEFKKTNAAFSASSALSDKLTVAGSINYFNTLQNGATTQGNGAGSTIFGLYGVTRSTDLDYYKNNYTRPDGTNNWYVPGRDNPFYSANENTFTSNLTRFLGNVTVGYDVLDWLNVSYRLGLDTYTDRRKRYITIGSTQATGSAGAIQDDTFFRNELNGDLIITAKKKNIFTDGLNMTALLGQNFNQRIYQNVSASGLGLAIPGFTNVSNSTNFTNTTEFDTKRRLLGYYAQLSFGYNNYLFLEATGRVDQSSTLPTNNNTYFYPSVSSSFVFTDAFDIKSDVFSLGKIRASFAKVGRDATPYQIQDTYLNGSFGNNTSSVSFPFGPTAGFGANTRIAAPNLKPEFTTSYEVGANFGFFKDRLTFDATFYSQGSKNQIVNVALPASSGYQSQTTNIGQLRNRGVELMLNGSAIRSKNVSWDISANFSKNDSKVIYIAPGVTSFGIAGDSFTGVTPSVYQGQPFGVIVGSKYQRSPSGELIVDPNTGLYNSTLNANQIIADPNRKWTAGITNTVRFKNFTFSGLVDFKKGGDIVSWTASTLRQNGSLEVTAVDREQPHILPGVIQNSDGTFRPNNIQIPGQTYWNGGFGGIGGGEFNVFDATTLRIREITLSYDLAGSVLKTKAIKNIRLTVYGRNLYYYAPNSPVDPELSTQGAGNIRGLELQSAPNTRNFGASLRVTF
ncbi:SusC/RagA family TonB-linked outer membrane protein [Pedobacter sp. UYP1]|jgi:TonB-linked SusC/RagA family outer membrane protein|uniref:SusC/RagA family TonB-linked outer membrane protein n=1 Tax=Pedobacter sp. UYP1 TaxID=1756396 RepID=UPI0033992945